MAFQGDSIFWVEVEKIVPNPFQPRREFDEEKLKELSDSIRMYGVLQPLTVTRKEVQRTDGTFYTQYELIAGERRLRASKLANLSQVPVIIREGDDNEQEKLELAIIENLQREDLNAVDRALAFKQLAETFSLSHTQVARKVGRSREYVSNSIRLLVLPEHMLTALKQGDMTEGHARTLLMLNDRPEEQDVIFREILLKKLSVRELEKIVRKIATDKVRKKDPAEFDDDLIEMEKQFTETLGTRVQIQKTDYGGKLTIDYFSVEDLEGMLLKMKDDRKLNENKESATASASLVEHTPLSIDENPQSPMTAVAEFNDENISPNTETEAELKPSEISDVKDMPEMEETENTTPLPQSNLLKDELNREHSETEVDSQNISPHENVVSNDSGTNKELENEEDTTSDASHDTDMTYENVQDESDSVNNPPTSTISDNNRNEPFDYDQLEDMFDNVQAPPQHNTSVADVPSNAVNNHEIGLDTSKENLQEVKEENQNGETNQEDGEEVFIQTKTSDYLPNERPSAELNASDLEEKFATGEKNETGINSANDESSGNFSENNDENKKTQPKKEDDSDLYSIRNFSI